MRQSEARLTGEKQTDEVRSRLTAILESSDEAIVEETLDGRIETWNGGAERLYGYSFAEVGGKHTSSLLLPGRSAEQLQALRNAGRSSTERYETQHRRKDGTWVDVSIGVCSIRDSRGEEIGRCFTARDVTPSKTAERLRAALKEKEVLLKEVHHRVKNNLQVISSLLNLQARHIEDGKALEMFKESQNRVRSIALIHEKLYQSKDLTHVGASGYLKNLVSNLLATYGVRSNAVALSVEPNDILLGVDLAIPLGLIVNELISNALKHAFVEGKRGEVRVDLQCQDHRNHLLCVSDNGRGFPRELDFRKAPSLGLQLVCTLTEQLGGSIELSRDQGTTFRVAFKAGA
ncbi:MAG TPA: histidine kinase dimerization/phosphoacceptor domain -containing protein [Myxococcales bacterium]